MKQFTSEYHQDYYNGWIYLATINKEDYYIQHLPSKDNPYPCTSIVYGEDPSEYISTTMSIKDMLDDNKVLSSIELYLTFKGGSKYINMIALVRGYAESQL